MGALSRRKGIQWEQELARRFQAVGIDAARNLTECRTGNAGDLDLPQDVPLLVQAKVGARPPVWEALKEAIEAAGPGVHPVAILKRNGAGGRKAEEVAVLPLEDFLELVEILQASGLW